MAAQAICCGYYGVFVVPDGRVRDRRGRRRSRSSGAIAASGWRSPSAALVAVVLVTPAFLPYLSLQRGRRIPTRAEGCGPVFGELERLLRELVVRARLDARPPAAMDGGVVPGIRDASVGVGGAWVADARSPVRAAGCCTAVWPLLALWASFGPTRAAVLGAVPRRADVRLAARAGALRADRRLRAVGSGGRRDCRRGCERPGGQDLSPPRSPSSPPAN